MTIGRGRHGEIIIITTIIIIIKYRTVWENVFAPQRYSPGGTGSAQQ